MKNIILIIILFLSNMVNSQNVISLTNKKHEDKKNGNYFKDTNGSLDPFIGIWVWENATNTAKMTIKLVKKEMHDGNGLLNYKEDILIGGYKYVENGIVIIDNLTFSTNYTDSNYAIIKSVFLTGPGLPEIRVQLYDVAKRKRLMGKFKINSNPNLPTLDPLTATMHLVPQKGWVDGTLYPDKVSLPGNTFPFDMVFTKQ